MSAWADGPKIRTDPVLRKALQRWLDAEQEPQTRRDALRAAAEIATLVDEILDQRVAEARSFRHTWAEIAATVGITRQSAHRRWRHLDAVAEAMAADPNAAIAPARRRSPSSRLLPWRYRDAWRPE